MLRSHFFVPFSGLNSVFGTGDWIGSISSWKRRVEGDFPLVV